MSVVLPPTAVALISSRMIFSLPAALHDLLA
jgi:hypothetical protein